MFLSYMLSYGFMSGRNIDVIGYIYCLLYVEEKFHPVIKHLFHNIYGEFSSLSYLYNNNCFSNISK